MSRRSARQSNTTTVNVTETAADVALRQSMDYRAAAIQLEIDRDGTRAKTVDEEERSVEAVLSTETPVEMPDWERWQMVPEVLVAAGMELPKRAKQIPLLDSHSRWSVTDQLGSIREIKVEKGQVIGRLYFSSAAEESWTKVREGHVTDVSVGYKVLKRTYVPADETKTIQGREYTGPVNVVTKWRMHEASITPVGADEQAKLRGEISHPASHGSRANPSHPKGPAMPPELRELCVERGMPADLNDEQALAWLNENRAAMIAPKAPATPAAGEERTAPAAKPEIDVEAVVTRALAEADKKRAEQRAAVRAEADTLCELAGVADFARDCYDLADVAAVRKAIQDEKAKRAAAIPAGFPIEFGRAQADKQGGAVQTALLMRCASMMQLSGEKAEAFLPAAQREKGWEHFRHASLIESTRMSLEARGFDCRGLAPSEIAMVGVGGPNAIPNGHLRVRSDAAYHTPGSFPKILQDAVNKSMMLGYTEYPATWREIASVGQPVPDFKTIHRMQFGAAPNLQVWNDVNPHAKASMADSEETYAVEARSLQIDISWKTLVNDDLAVLSKVPMRLGAAAGRTENAVVWSVITSNPTMRDSVALYAAATGNRKRTNLTTGAGAPSTSTINTLTNLMRQMRGENTPEQVESEDILGLTPSVIVGPSALEKDILVLLNSIADPAASQSGVGNYARMRNLKPVIEPLLDASSTTAWYLFADKSQIDTVEITHLQGQETPLLIEDTHTTLLSRTFVVLQTYAAKAMDHRGTQKHAGA